jgi:catalase
MRVDGNYGGTIGYEPNSQGEWQEQADFSEPPLNLSGAAMRWDHREDDDYFSQPGALFNLMNEKQQQALFANTADSISGASIDIQKRHIRHCLKADQAYGEGIAKALGIALTEL